MKQINELQDEKFMNNKAQQLRRIHDEFILKLIQYAKKLTPAEKKHFIRGGGTAGGDISVELNRRILPMRVSKDAIEAMIEDGFTIFDLYHADRKSPSGKKLDEELTEKEKKWRKAHRFISGNKKRIEDRRAQGQRCFKDHNPPNKFVIDELMKGNRKPFDEQTLDFITIEEDQKLDLAKMKCKGSKIERDALCSPKVSIVDLYATNPLIIEEFWRQVGIDKRMCYDPCAFDARWGCGKNSDILPMKKEVECIDFFKVDKMPEGTKHCVGNLPFEYFKEWIEHSLKLEDDHYYMCNADVALKYFNGHIVEFWAITGCDGNQKDWRSKAEFEVLSPIGRSIIWSCIAHFTNRKVPKFNVHDKMTPERRKNNKFVSIGQHSVIDRDERVHEIKGFFEGGHAKEVNEEINNIKKKLNYIKRGKK